jgi:hypothetical protein
MDILTLEVWFSLFSEDSLVNPQKTSIILSDSALSSFEILCN